MDRYLAAYMADKTGAHFAARISGVTRFALFVTVTESGASGIVPVSTLPDDYWQHDRKGADVDRPPDATGLPTGTGGRSAPGGSEPGHRRPGLPCRAGDATARETVPPQVNRLAVLLLLLLIVPVHAQPVANGGFDPGLVANVYSVALAFMEPRILDPVPVPTLTVWGLRGLTALDPNLTAGQRDGKLVLYGRDGVLTEQPVPAGDTPEAWAAAAVRSVRSGGRRIARGAAGRHARHHPELLRRVVQPPRPLLALRPAARGGGGSGRAQRHRRHGHSSGAACRRHPRAVGAWRTARRQWRACGRATACWRWTACRCAARMPQRSPG